MNIDFIKLLKLLFPTFLRSGTIGALLTAIGTDLNALYTAFKTWQTDARLQAAITCQVMYMEAILNYRLFGNFLRTIYITDGDGVTVDFHVNITPGMTVNGQLLVGLIEKYKLTGKRYDVVQSTVDYTIEWGDPLCQLQELIYTAEWSSPVCQLVLQNTLIDNKITPTIESSGLDVMFTLQYPYTPGNNVDLTVYFDAEWDSGTKQIGLSFTIPAGGTYALIGLQPPKDNSAYLSTITVTGTIPITDTLYLYTY